MRYDIKDWDALVEAVKECTAQDRLVFYVDGQEIRTRIEHNIPESQKD